MVSCSQSHWRDLDGELDAWSARGEVATLWWRDDDAITVTPQLRSLCRLSEHSRVPLSLAVIARDADRTLLDLPPQCLVMQHGWAHCNHAPEGQKSSEFGEHRSLDERCHELAAGRKRLQALFGELFVPIFVPPWNRVGADLTAALASLKFAGLSTFEARHNAWARPNVAQVNCHIDPIDWRSGGTFRGEAWTVRRLVEVLRARRLADIDASEPTGLLTHHLRHDESFWPVLKRLFEFLSHRRHCVRWLPANEVFGG